MRKVQLILVLLSILFVMVACTSGKANQKEISLPEDLPEFVTNGDFEVIDWEKKAIEFGNRGIIGNENKSGVLGLDSPSLDGQKWMWHLWGIENPEKTKLTIVGLHKETRTVHQILTDGWTRTLGGPNNDADGHTPSSVKVPETGEWALLLYTDDKLFDTLIYEIKE